MHKRPAHSVMLLGFFLYLIKHWSENLPKTNRSTCRIIDQGHLACGMSRVASICFFCQHVAITTTRSVCNQIDAAKIEVFYFQCLFQYGLVSKEVLYMHCIFWGA